MKIILFVVIVVLVVSSLALAERGCFLYPDSPLYCTSLSIEEAEDECFNFERCEVERHFLNQDCRVAECQKVLCKSSCTMEYRSQCVAGEVPEGQEDEWCSSGCCRFLAGSPSCSYEDNKWQCERSAKNHASVQFHFASASEEACSSICEQINPATFLVGLQLEEVSLRQRPLEKEDFADLGEGANVKEATGDVKEDVSVTEEDKIGNFTWLFFVILFFVALAFVFYKMGLIKLAKKTFASPIKRPSRIFSPFSTSSQVQGKIRNLRRKRKHKVEEKRRDEMLLEFGLTPPKKQPTEFHKLNKIIRTHKRKNPRFENLDDFLAKIKKEKIKDQKKRNIFSKLNKLVKKKRR